MPIFFFFIKLNFLVNDFFISEYFLCKRITWLGLSKYEKVKKAGLKAAKKR